MPEYKSGHAFTKAIEGRTVIGIFGVHGVIDDGSDRSHPGAFANYTVNGRDRAVFLWMHNPDMPPTASINYIRDVPRSDLPPEVLALAPDATGGGEVSRTYLDTPRGNEILAGIKANAIREMSYAYDVTSHSITTDETTGNQVRELYGVKLFDVSDVSWGMMPYTMGSKEYEVAIGSKAAWKDRPFADHTESLEEFIREYIHRAAELYERRTKAGRTFSAANATRIGSIASFLVEAGGDLTQMLKDSEPRSEASNDGVRLLLESERIMARLHGVRF